MCTKLTFPKEAQQVMKMCNLAAKRALERSQTVLVRVVEVLVEDRNPKNGNEVMGRARQGRQVLFPGDTIALNLYELRTKKLLLPHGRASCHVGGCCGR